MSKTWHHGRKAKEKYFGPRWHDDDKPTPPKRKRANSNYWHWMSTPSWWIREMMTRPQRAKTRQALHLTMRGLEVDFPLPKKPHIYYW